MPAEETVFVVDDDEAVRDSLGALLEASGFRVKTFGSAAAFLASDLAEERACLVTDIRMPDMDGLELQLELKRRGSRLPVIVITGHGDVPLAVRAMKAGAIEFLEKPYDDQTLLDSLRLALSQSGREAGDAGMAAGIREKLATLTPRERDVFDLVVLGKPNKVIAYELSISQRTVEIHRGRLMHKMGARNLADLVRMGMAAGTAHR
jgi:two-component system response regulator FixJ